MGDKPRASRAWITRPVDCGSVCCGLGGGVRVEAPSAVGVLASGEEPQGPRSIPASVRPARPAPGARERLCSCPGARRSRDPRAPADGGGLVRKTTRRSGTAGPSATDREASAVCPTALSAANTRPWTSAPAAKSFICVSVPNSPASGPVVCSVASSRATRLVPPKLVGSAPRACASRIRFASCPGPSLHCFDVM